MALIVFGTIIAIEKNTLNLHPIFEVETYPELVKLMQNDFEKKY